MEVKGTGLPIVVTRVFQNRKASGRTWGRIAFNNWDLAIPKIQRSIGKALYHDFETCENDGSSYSILIDGVGDFRSIALNSQITYPTLATGTTNTQVIHFNNNWLLTCEAFTTRSNTTDVNGNLLSKQITDGYTLISPDGTKYRFGYHDNETMSTAATSKIVGPHIRSNQTKYVTDIVDKFGNYLTYNYQNRSSSGGNILTIRTIEASDGRKVTFNFSNIIQSEIGHTYDDRNRLISITDGVRVVNYNYEKVYYQISGESFQRYSMPLKKVIYEEGLYWQYSYIASTLSTAVGGSSGLLTTVVSPWGAAVNYEYSGPTSTGCGNNASSTVGVSNRIVSNNGKQYSYSYALSRVSQGTDYVINVTKTSPAKKEIFSHYCIPDERHSPKHLSLIKYEVYGGTNNSTLLESVIKNWDTISYGSMNHKHRLVLSKVTTDTQYTQEFSNFDPYGNYQTELSRGVNNNNQSISYEKHNTFYNNPSKWVINKVDNEFIADALNISRDFNNLGQVTRENRNGIVSNFSYNNDGTLYSKSDDLNNTTFYSDYYRGVPEKVTDPIGHQTIYSVDQFANIIKKTDPLNNATLFNFDKLDRLKSIDYPEGENLIVNYTGNSQFDVIRGNFQETHYLDGLNRTTQKRYKDTTTDQVFYRFFEYDSYGRITFSSINSTSSDSRQADGISSNYDALNRKLFDKFINRAWTSQAGSTSSTVYFTTYNYPNKRQVQITDPNGYTNNSYFSAYGSPDKKFITSIVQPSSSGMITTLLSKDVLGKLKSVTQGGKTITYNYHSTYTDYPISEVYPNFSIFYGRDAIGNMVSKKVGNSSTTYYSYDANGRPSLVNYPSGTADVSYEYFANNSIKSIKNGIGDLYYSYDGNGNLINRQLQVGNENFSFSYAYNNNDALTSVTYDKDNTVINYNPNAFKQSTSAGMFASNVTYHPNGSMKSFAYGNNINTVLDVDFTGVRISKIQASNGANLKIKKTYNYDGLNNVTSIVDGVDATSSVFNFSYDGSSRLLNANSSAWGGGITYTYDAKGNILSQSLPSGSLNYTYNSTNFLSSVSGIKNQTFQYDNYGNVTHNSQGSFVYNDAGQLISSTVGGKNKTYAYDATGRRVKVSSTSGTEIEIYDDNERLLWLRDVSGLDHKKIYLGTKLIAQVSGNSISYVHFDTLGSTIALSDESRNFTYEHYFPFGEKVFEPQSTNNDQWYTGKRFDEDTSLIYMQARYYDPVIGRFYSNDPMGFRDVHSFNRYAYANNNPYKYTDPDGKDPLSPYGMMRNQQRISEIEKNDPIFAAQARTYQASAIAVLSFSALAFQYPIIGGGLALHEFADDPSPGPIPSGAREMVDPKNLIPTQSKSEMTGSKVKKLTKSMKKDGFVEGMGDDGSVVAVQNGVGRLEIENGHHRVQAAINAKIDEIPVEVHRN